MSGQSSLETSFRFDCPLIKKHAYACFFANTCGERGIRTPGSREGTTVFKTAAIDHSAISPVAKLKIIFIMHLIDIKIFCMFDIR
jgi:hypothetical protein